MPEADRPEQVGSAVAILNVGPVDQHGHQKAERVGDDVALASLDLLAGVPRVKPEGRLRRKSRRFRWF
jgi:hypothetical protein